MLDTASLSRLIPSTATLLAAGGLLGCDPADTSPTTNAAVARRELEFPYSCEDLWPQPTFVFVALERLDPNPSGAYPIWVDVTASDPERAKWPDVAGFRPYRILEKEDEGDFMVGMADYPSAERLLFFDLTPQPVAMP